MKTHPPLKANISNFFPLKMAQMAEIVAQKKHMKNNLKIFKISDFINQTSSCFKLAEINEII